MKTYWGVEEKQTVPARERLGTNVPAATDLHPRMNGVVCADRAEKL
jgi:hypothetical protein